jgi:hypothetical protein
VRSERGNPLAYSEYLENGTVTADSNYAVHIRGIAYDIRGISRSTTNRHPRNQTEA